MPTSADGDLLLNLLSQEQSRADDRGGHSIELEPYGYRWLRAGGLERPLTSGQTPPR